MSKRQAYFQLAKDLKRILLDPLGGAALGITGLAYVALRAIFAIALFAGVVYWLTTLEPSLFVSVTILFIFLSVCYAHYRMTKLEDRLDSETNANSTEPTPDSEQTPPK